MFSENEVARLEARCGTLSRTANEYVATDFVVALLETVMDYRNSAATLERAGAYFEAHAWNDARTLDDLELILARFSADKAGNDALAQYLWGYHHWRRAQELRGLVAYFRERDVTDLESLKAWATASTERDFVGYVKGLGPAVYRGLVMRLGVDTIKPDVHVLRFVAAAVGRRGSEREAVEGLEVVAKRLGIRPRDLDRSIWEYQRALRVNRGGAVPRTPGSAREGPLG
jgi:hypothetical protein